MSFNISMPVLIRHLWQLKTVVFIHWCLICRVLFDEALCFFFLCSLGKAVTNMTQPIEECHADKGKQACSCF